MMHIPYQAMTLDIASSIQQSFFD